MLPVNSPIQLHIADICGRQVWNQVCSFLTLTIGSFTTSVMLIESLLDTPTYELMSVPSVMMIINIRMSVSRVLRDPPKPFHVMDIGHIGFDVGTSRLDVVRVESAAAAHSGERDH